MGDYADFVERCEAISVLKPGLFRKGTLPVITDDPRVDDTVLNIDDETDLDRASKCPASVTPHPIRRGYITGLLGAGVPIEVVNDRCNVSPGIIEEHYDVRSADEKMRQRQEVIREVME